MTQLTTRTKETGFADGDMAFALSIMPHLGEGNVSVSATSIRTALGMLYEGARGETAKQIAETAKLSEDSKTRRSEIKKLMGAFNVADAPYNLRGANGIWVGNTFHLNENFRDVITGEYMAEANLANFEGNADGERQIVNKWVSEKTEGKIPALFSPGSFNKGTVLALANALYFKGEWEEKFDEKLTEKKDFTLPNREVVQVDMMRKGRIETEKVLPEHLYGTFDGTQVAVLPYKGKRLVKMVLLPPRGTDVPDLVQHLSDTNFGIGGLAGLLESREFSRLDIPKHEVSGNYDLKAPLEAMGIENMWSFDTADLSGIGPGKLAVSKGVHQTYFKSDEQGSEGAAATGIAVMRESCVMPTKSAVEFVADRPYLEAVIDQHTGAALFLNRIEDPR